MGASWGCCCCGSRAGGTGTFEVLHKVPVVTVLVGLVGAVCLLLVLRREEAEWKPLKEL